MKRLERKWFNFGPHSDYPNPGMVMTWERYQKNLTLKNISKPNILTTSWDEKSLLPLDFSIISSSFSLSCTIPNSKKESETWKEATFPMKGPLCFWIPQWSHFLETQPRKNIEKIKSLEKCVQENHQYHSQ